MLFRFQVSFRRIKFEGDKLLKGAYLDFLEDFLLPVQKSNPDDFLVLKYRESSSLMDKIGSRERCCRSYVMYSVPRKVASGGGSSRKREIIENTTFVRIFRSIGILSTFSRDISVEFLQHFLSNDFTVFAEIFSELTVFPYFRCFQEFTDDKLLLDFLLKKLKTYFSFSYSFVFVYIWIRRRGLPARLRFLTFEEGSHFTPNTV